MDLAASTVAGQSTIGDDRILEAIAIEIPDRELDALRLREPGAREPKRHDRRHGN
ncbi:MAG: hypothetical protein HZA52_06835 [Planctomycetes bacterium]|nr:hypothetical protein [Planctomycetota bacterium]